MRQCFHCFNLSARSRINRARARRSRWSQDRLDAGVQLLRQRIISITENEDIELLIDSLLLLQMVKRDDSCVL